MRLPLKLMILFYLTLLFFSCGESNEITRLNQENLSLQKDILSLKTEIMSLDATLKEKETELAECESKDEGKIASLKDEISSLKSKISSLEQLLEEKESQLEACGALQKEVVCPITIIRGTISVFAGRYDDYTFFVFDKSPIRLKGNFKAAGGGEFEIYVFDDLNFENWKAFANAKALFNPGRIVIGEINLPITKPGFYHIVFNNRFSLLTTKNIYASIDQIFE